MDKKKVLAVAGIILALGLALVLILSFLIGGERWREMTSLVGFAMVGLGYLFQKDRFSKRMTDGTWQQQILRKHIDETQYYRGDVENARDGEILSSLLLVIGLVFILVGIFA